MIRPQASLAPEYFERMFQDTKDPWDLESSTYERAKYRHSIDALGGRTYDLGFEVGCARGVLTHHLAEHCRTLLAIDVSETALGAARNRCSALDHVTFGRMIFPAQTPVGGRFDLVILSEVAYYWDDADIGRAADWLGAHMAADGDIVLVHWTGPTNYPQGGDEAVAKLYACLIDRIDVVTAQRRDQYRLDLWRKRS